MALPPPVTLAEAHILTQARLRALAVQAVANAWQSLPAYNLVNVAQFLAIVVPIINAAQRQSAALTNAYLGQATGRPPLPLDVQKVIGPAIRNGTPPEVVYRRPFVTTWTALKRLPPEPPRSPPAPAAPAPAVTPASVLAPATVVPPAARVVEPAPERVIQARNAGLAHAKASAAMDVQNTMRHTLKLIGDTDILILGYRRVPDATACDFCKLIAGRRYLTSELQPVHANCGCGVDVITEANRGDFFGKLENDLSIPGVAVREHGELGPLLVDPDDHFTTEDEIAA